MVPTYDEKIVQAMETFGGSFVKALANAMRLADMKNYQILRKAFSDYFKTYEEMSRDKD